MIVVMLTTSPGSDVVARTFPRSVTLRDLQRPLCSLYRQRFPATMAAVTVEGRHYDSFNDSPFAVCGEGATVEIIFKPTDDPFFYDQADRRAAKRTCGRAREQADAKTSVLQQMCLQWQNAR